MPGVRRVWIAIVALWLGAGVGLAAVEQPARPQALRLQASARGTAPTVAESGPATTNAAALSSTGLGRPRRSGGNRTPKVTTTAPVAPTMSTVPLTPTQDTVATRPPAMQGPDRFYVQPFGDSQVLRALDWSGNELASFRLTKSTPWEGSAYSSPNGALFAIGWSVYDSTGAYVRELTLDAWGDDNAHACYVNNQHPGESADAPMALYLLSLDGSSVRVANLPGTGGSQMVLSCNPLLDRAVVETAEVVGDAWRARRLVVRLSDGSVTEEPAGCRLGGSGASNGRLISAADGPSDYGPGTICDIDTGRVVGHTPTFGGLNGDGSLVFSADGDACGPHHNAFVYDWRAGKRVWEAKESGFNLGCDQLWVPWLVHRGGDEVAFQTVTVNSNGSASINTGNESAPGDVIIVKPGRATARVATSIAYGRVF